MWYSRFLYGSSQSLVDLFLLSLLPDCSFIPASTRQAEIKYLPGRYPVEEAPMVPMALERAGRVGGPARSVVLEDIAAGEEAGRAGGAGPAEVAVGLACLALSHGFSGMFYISGCRRVKEAKRKDKSKQIKEKKE